MEAFRNLLLVIWLCIQMATLHAQGLIFFSHYMLLTPFLQDILFYYFFYINTRKGTVVRKKKWRKEKIIKRGGGVGLSYVTMPLVLLMELPLRRRVMDLCVTLSSWTVSGVEMKNGTVEDRQVKLYKYSTYFWYIYFLYYILFLMHFLNTRVVFIYCYFVICNFCIHYLAIVITIVPKFLKEGSKNANCNPKASRQT